VRADFSISALERARVVYVDPPSLMRPVSYTSTMPERSCYHVGQANRRQIQLKFQRARREHSDATAYNEVLSGLFNIIQHRRPGDYQFAQPKLVALNMAGKRNVHRVIFMYFQ
jgi:hypothetical protein